MTLPLAIALCVALVTYIVMNLLKANNTPLPHWDGQEWKTPRLWLFSQQTRIEYNDICYIVRKVTRDNGVKVFAPTKDLIYYIIHPKHGRVLFGRFGIENDQIVVYYTKNGDPHLWQNKEFLGYFDSESITILYNLLKETTPCI